MDRTFADAIEVGRACKWIIFGLLRASSSLEFRLDFACHRSIQR